MRAKDVIVKARSLGACSGSDGVTDWKSLCWLFFSPQGREFCEERNFPPIEMFRNMGENVKPYGVYVDAGHVDVTNPGNIAVIGDTDAVITVDDNERVQKVILMHGGKAKIMASGYAVILLVNIGGEVDIEKDETVVVL